jgi:hypothetical protein
MATKPLQPPRHGDPFVDRMGAPLQWPQAWIDEVTRVVNTDLSDLTALSVRVAALEPQYVTKGNADSPYSAVDMDYVTADMDGSGDLIVVLPSTGRVWITRDGSSDTLTLEGTVNGVVDPTILFDGTTVALWHNGTEWRYA